MSIFAGLFAALSVIIQNFVLNGFSDAFGSWLGNLGL